MTQLAGSARFVSTMRRRPPPSPRAPRPHARAFAEVDRPPICEHRHAPARRSRQPPEQLSDVDDGEPLELLFLISSLGTMKTSRPDGLSAASYSLYHRMTVAISPTGRLPPVESNALKRQ